MTARKKYSLCIRNYNRCVRTGNNRRALYWGHEADRAAQINVTSAAGKISALLSISKVQD
jgi:hypothetical protein